MSIAEAAHYRTGNRFSTLRVTSHRSVPRRSSRPRPETRLAYPVLHPLIAGIVLGGFERELVCNTFDGSIGGPRLPDQTDGGGERFRFRASRPDRNATGDLRGDHGAHARRSSRRQPTGGPSRAGTADTADDRCAADPIRRRRRADRLVRVEGLECRVAAQPGVLPGPRIFSAAHWRDSRRLLDRP